MKRPSVFWAVIAVAVVVTVGSASCQNKGRAPKPAGESTAPGGPELQLSRTDEAVLARAEAIAQHDELRAIESLRACQTQACSDGRVSLAKRALERLPQPPFADAAGLQRYLRFQEAAGNDSVCALVLALATQPKPEGPVRDALVAAVTAELDSVKKRLGTHDPKEPALSNAEGFGEALDDATDCAAVRTVAARLANLPNVVADATGTDPEKVAQLYDDKTRMSALEFGLLTGKLARLTAPAPTAAAGRHAKNTRKTGAKKTKTSHR